MLVTNLQRFNQLVHHDQKEINQKRKNNLTHRPHAYDLTRLEIKSTGE
jgi:hypothetical protein